MAIEIVNQCRNPHVEVNAKRIAIPFERKIRSMEDPALDVIQDRMFLILWQEHKKFQRIPGTSMFRREISLFHERASHAMTKIMIKQDLTPATALQVAKGRRSTARDFNPGVVTITKIVSSERV